MILGTIGGILGLVTGLGVQSFWLNFSAGNFVVPYGAPSLNYPVFVACMLAPTLLITFFVFLLIYVQLKMSTIAGMSGETTHKANFLVRGWGEITSDKTNFMFTYKIKNILRQIGKSSFIFVSIVGSTLIFAFGSAFSSWGDNASMKTQAMFGSTQNAKWYFDAGNSGNIPEEALSNEQLDQEIKDGTITPYTFGDWNTSLAGFIDLLATTNITPSEKTRHINTWKTNVGEYMIDNTVDNTYMQLGLLEGGTIDVDRFIAQILSDLNTLMFIPGPGEYHYLRQLLLI